MKFGIRKPSLKKSLKARTTGRLKRTVKKALIPQYGKKGMGWIKNPKKAMYNKIYRKSTVSLFSAGIFAGKSIGKKTTGRVGSNRQLSREQLGYQNYSVIEGESEAMKVCKFCGSENIDSASVCSSCGANEFKYKCGNCGCEFEKGNFCPQCGVKVGAKAKKCPICGTEYYSAACPDCGYTHNANKSTTVYSNTIYQPKKNKNTWLWVLGWIFIFPVPLTILMLRNQKLSTWKKIGIITVAWILYLILAFANGGSTNDYKNTNSSKVTAKKAQQQYIDSETEKSMDSTLLDAENIAEEQKNPTQESTIEDLANGFNALSENKLEYVEDFVVSDKGSGHYRTEFRLPAYKDAVGKSYNFGESVVDIISCQSVFENIDVRIYAYNATLDQCKMLVQYVSKLLDPTMTDEAVSDTISYIEENKVANGYYYGKLGLLLIGSGDQVYNLMIKTD